LDKQLKKIPNTINDSKHFTDNSNLKNKYKGIKGKITTNTHKIN
jgi:hypothetical protein